MPNPFGLDKRADGRTHTHTLLMSERMRDQMKIPFNIVWNFSLAFSSLLLRSILGGSFWIFHYLMNSYEFGESKAISHVHVHGQMATHLRISSKNKVILIIITNRFLFIFRFMRAVVHFLSSFISFLYLRFCGISFAFIFWWSSFFICWLPLLLLFAFGFYSVFGVFVCVWLCYFASIWICHNGPQKNKYINYTTKLNHRFWAPAMIHQNWKLTAGQGIH